MGKKGNNKDLWTCVGVMFIIFSIGFLYVIAISLDGRIKDIENPEIVEVHNYLNADDFEEVCYTWKIVEALNITSNNSTLQLNDYDPNFHCNWICSSGKCNLFCNSKLIEGYNATFINMSICNQTILVKSDLDDKEMWNRQ